VRSGLSTEVRLDIGPTGSIEIQNLEHVGRITVDIGVRSGDQVFSESVSFEQPPYLIEWVQARDWEVRVRVGADVTEWAPVTVERGRTAVLDAFLHRK
jgi:hypothetical protein